MIRDMSIEIIDVDGELVVFSSHVRFLTYVLSKTHETIEIINNKGIIGDCTIAGALKELSTFLSITQEIHNELIASKFQEQFQNLESSDTIIGEEEATRITKAVKEFTEKILKGTLKNGL